jgi:hypothetical protein
MRACPAVRASAVAKLARLSSRLLFPSLLLILGLGGQQAQGRVATACPPRTLDPAYLRGVERALRAREDVWGQELLSKPGGPTYNGVRPYLKPLMFAKAAHGRPLTASGVYYIPFAEPGAGGAGTVALHVADGSQVLAQTADGRSLTIGVGRNGRERFGSCLRRLRPPGLHGGYLPILVTQYVDSAGVRYRQESFAAIIPETRSLVSFVRVTADARGSTSASEVRFTPSEPGLADDGMRLVQGRDTHLFFSPGGSFDGSGVRYPVRVGNVNTVYAAWLIRPGPSRALTVERSRYERARQTIRDYWERRLADAASIVVPEARVVAAERSLLIQDLELTWRYSIGNAYEEFSFPEGVDVAQVMSEWGIADVGRSILQRSLTRDLRPYPNWKAGQKLVGFALHYRLFRDRSLIDRATPDLLGYVDALASQIAANPHGMLHRERYSSDIPNSVLGLHSQAVVWQGLRDMARVWEQTGHPSLAVRCARLAARLEAGLRRAVRESQQKLSDGSLFIPARLLDSEAPYDTLTTSRLGSYWNLVMPYALASGLFAPRSAEATGALAYMLGHGSRLLGLVRAGGYALYGKRAPQPISGTDEVYGLNVARFLADNDRADQLVLSLYGHLAAGMTEGTFVSGEGASVAPLAHEYYRSMYLPPNGASNATFLATLRLMLVHETLDRNGAPRGLELAYSTPRAWLQAGKRIAVSGVPTSFGPVSYSIWAGSGAVRVAVEVPDRLRAKELTLRLRLPRGVRISGVTLAGRKFHRLDAAHATLDLSGLSGSLELVAHVSHTRVSP